MHSLFIHGVGQQTAGYSHKAQVRLAAALQKRGVQSYGQEVLWAPVLDHYEAQMAKEVGRRGSKNRPLQRLVVGTLADALCYQNRREDILDLVDQAYLKLRCETVTIFAHSLGCLIAADWMRSRNRVPVASFHTFGCNLELFSLGGKFQCPAQVQQPGKWTSYFDPTDMLGWPVAGFQPQVRDVEVEVGGLLGRTGLAHLEYWSDSDFWSETIPKCLRP